MGRFFRLFLHYRPLVLTFVVFCAIAAVLALANATYPTMAFESDGKCTHTAYGGWPLVWSRWVSNHGHTEPYVCGWQINPLRLAGNGALWLAMLLAPAALAEWLLRCYPPRLRWRLRTMLIVIALVAAFLGWFAGARKRANEQDEILAALHNDVRMERWGPRWLDIVGLDRFRRRIVKATLDVSLGPGFGSWRPTITDDKQAERVLKKLARLPKVQYLFLKVGDITPGMAETLGGMRQLRVLSVVGRGEPIPKACLAAIGRLTNLEHLELDRTELADNDLEALASLTNLKSLRLTYLSSEDPRLLHCLPALPRLEFIEIEEASGVGDDDLQPLAALPNLRSLNLDSRMREERRGGSERPATEARKSPEDLEDCHHNWYYSAAEQCS